MGTTSEILVGMPHVNHHAVNLWSCAILSGVVMFPRQAGANYEHILSLPPSERCKHLGTMMVRSAAMTKYNNGQGAFAACALVAGVTKSSPVSDSRQTQLTLQAQSRGLQLPPFELQAPTCRSSPS